MAHKTKSQDIELRLKMETLAKFVMQLNPDELWVFIDTLLSDLDNETKEDLCDAIILAQRKDEEKLGEPAEAVFAEIRREKGIAD